MIFAVGIHFIYQGYFSIVFGNFCEWSCWCIRNYMEWHVFEVGSGVSPSENHTQDPNKESTSGIQSSFHQKMITHYLLMFFYQIFEEISKS